MPSQTPILAAVLAAAFAMSPAFADNGNGKGHGHAAALAPDDKLLAVGSNDGVIRLWDWAASKEVRKLRRVPDHVRIAAQTPVNLILELTP